jgi:GNAT superfamily N-acetyltransferase
VCRSTTWRPLSSSVAVAGASCRTVPSPSARALRLDGLRAGSPAALDELLGRLPPPPWDASLRPEEPVASWLAAAGFEPYAETVVMARSLQGMRAAAPVPGVEVEQYRNDWAEAFQAAEAQAMADDPFYAEMGTPTGFEGAAGRGAFRVALRGERLVGFAQASLPDGRVNWIGVVPEERRQGIGALLVTEIARQTARARGTHLHLEAIPGGAAGAFWAAQGFRERGRLVYLIRRG